LAFGAGTIIGMVAFGGTVAMAIAGKKTLGDVLRAGVEVLPGGKAIRKWGPLIKRSINYADPRRVKGFFGEFSAAPRFPGWLDQKLPNPQAFFRIKAGYQISVEAFEIGENTGDLIEASIAPLDQASALVEDIGESLNNLDQHQEAEELFEEMEIQRPGGSSR
jgi:hypothetical protein